MLPNEFRILDTHTLTHKDFKMTTLQHFKVLIQQHCDLLVNEVDDLECPQCGHRMGNPPRPAQPEDLEVVATARDIDRVHEGKELLLNGFAETLFSKGGDDPAERPIAYQNAMSGFLPREPGTYDLNVVNASVTIDGVVHTNRSLTIELVNPAVELVGWQSNVDSSISLMRPGATGKFGQTFQAGTILRGARFLCTNDSPCNDSRDIGQEQESSSIWGGSYATLFELAAKFGCDVWLTISQLMCDPNPNTFFFKELRKQVVEFPNKVKVQYSTDLHGDNEQSERIRSRASDYYPNDPENEYAKMVGRLSGTCAWQMNEAGVEHVLPIGFSDAMLKEFEKSSGGLLPDYWCQQSQDDDRTWELLK